MQIDRTSQAEEKRDSDYPEDSIGLEIINL